VETKKYYVRKELILEIEVEQNPEEHNEPDVPINPMDCRLEWFMPSRSVGGAENFNWVKYLNQKIKIDTADIHVMEDAMTRCHTVKSLRVIDEGPRKEWNGAAEWGMSETLVGEQEYVSEEVYDDHDLDDYEDSDNVTPLPRMVSYWKLIDLHLPHELEKHEGQNWQLAFRLMDPDTDGNTYHYNDTHRFIMDTYAEPSEPERTETDLTDFMPKDEIDDVSSKSVILEVIEGGKSTEK
jgi:hypothetical protein